MNGLWLLRILGAYVLLQFSWWAYLLVNTGGPEAKWMVLGEGGLCNPPVGRVVPPGAQPQAGARSIEARKKPPSGGDA